MSISVKKLIEELEKIPNKFMEVEIYVRQFGVRHEISEVKSTGKKILILTEYNKDE
jgi:hypothetical protein